MAELWVQLLQGVRKHSIKTEREMIKLTLYDKVVCIKNEFPIEYDVKRGFVSALCQIVNIYRLHKIQYVIMTPYLPFTWKTIKYGCYVKYWV